jgi:hypothetical protein
MVHYRVLVHTANSVKAGTDSTVQLTLVGMDGRTAKTVKISGKGGYLETGTYSTFDIETDDVGDLKAIIIRSSYTGDGPGWILDHIKVQKVSTNAIWFFPCLASIDDTVARNLPAQSVFKDIPISWTRPLMLQVPESQVALLSEKEELELASENKRLTTG